MIYRVNNYEQRQHVKTVMYKLAITINVGVRAARDTCRTRKYIACVCGFCMPN